MCKAMSRLAQLAGSQRSLISFLSILLGVTAGCAVRQNASITETISNEDVVQTQPVVHSYSFAMGRADAAKQLVSGFYPVENQQWRWTAGNFSILLATPAAAATRGANLLFVFALPDAILQRTGPITLTASLNETEVGKATYDMQGSQRFFAKIPSALLQQSPVAIDFHLDRYVAKGVLEAREFGVIAESISLEANENR